MLPALKCTRKEHVHHPRNLSFVHIIFAEFWYLRIICCSRQRANLKQSVAIQHIGIWSLEDNSDVKVVSRVGIENNICQLHDKRDNVVSNMYFPWKWLNGWRLLHNCKRSVQGYLFLIFEYVIGCWTVYFKYGIRACNSIPICKQMPNNLNWFQFPWIFQ